MTAFLVCFKNLLSETVYLLLKELPSEWNEGFPTYNMGDLIDSAIAEDPEDRVRFNWRSAGDGRTALEYFDYMHVVPGDCFRVTLDEDKKSIRIDIWVCKYATPDMLNAEVCISKQPESNPADDSADTSDCVYAGDVDPSDMGSYVEEQSEDEQPALTHGYLICHKVNNKKRYVLMWELPISWTSNDTFYYYGSDIIERVVPGTKYNFVSLNMSAYAYGEEYMRPGDIISCAMVGNRIDSFVRIDRYLVRSATRAVFRSDVEGDEGSTDNKVYDVVSTPVCLNADGEKYYTFERGVVDSYKVVDEVNESVDQILSDNVNHPSHYTSHPSGVECIDITKHHDFCIGNAIKYLWRQGLKQDADKSVKEKRIEDLKKAVWYINAEIDLIEKDRQDSGL